MLLWSMATGMVMWVTLICGCFYPRDLRLVIIKFNQLRKSVRWIYYQVRTPHCGTTVIRTQDIFVSNSGLGQCQHIFITRQVFKRDNYRMDSKTWTECFNRCGRNSVARGVSVNLRGMLTHSFFCVRGVLVDWFKSVLSNQGHRLTDRMRDPATLSPQTVHIGAQDC